MALLSLDFFSNRYMFLTNLENNLRSSSRYTQKLAR